MQSEIFFNLIFFFAFSTLLTHGSSLGDLSPPYLSPRPPLALGRGEPRGVHGGTPPGPIPNSNSPTSKLIDAAGVAVGLGGEGRGGAFADQTAQADEPTSHRPN